MQQFIRLFLQLLIMTIIFSSNLFAQSNEDGPDLNYEAFLHDIYEQYYSKPMSDSDWDKIIGNRGSEEYSIQNGDNLWDLSRTFFGDGNYWPKIWSVNSRIRNPHLIEPTNLIRFRLGNESEAPSFAITEPSPVSPSDEAFGEQVQEESIEFADLDTALGSLEDDFLEDDQELTDLEEEFLSDEEIEDIVIPPPSIPVVPVSQNYPPSLPPWKTLSDEYFSSMSIQLGDKPDLDLEPIVPLTYFVDENDPPGVGRVVNVESGNSFGAQHQYMYLRLSRGVGKVGKTFLAVKKMGQLEGVFGKKELGQVFEVQGVLEVQDKLEAVEAYRSPDFEVFRARVVVNLTAVEVGSELFEDDVVYTRLNRKGRLSKVSGMIVGGEFATKRYLATNYSLVYVNRGSTDGLEVGDILPIYANYFLRSEKPYVITNNQPTGLLKIARVSELYATAYVVENSGVIQIGDFVGHKESFERNYMGLEKFNKIRKRSHDLELQKLRSDIMGEKPESTKESKSTN